MSSEIFGQSIKITASTNTPLAHVQALIKTFLEHQNNTLKDELENNIELDWELEKYDFLNGIMLLKCKNISQKFDPLDIIEPSYYSQIVIKAVSNTNIQIGYDPEGGIDKEESSSTWGSDANSSPAFSKFKNITGSSTVNWTGTGSAFYFANYEDAITLFFLGTNTIAYAAHVGKIYLPDNRSDLKVGIDGSGILVGKPSVVFGATLNNDWLTQQTNISNRLVSSCIKTSNTTWSTVRTFDATATQYVADVAGKSRLVPFTLSGYFPTAGEVGRTKYLRAYKTALPNLTLLESAINDSKQAWIGWSVLAGTPLKLLMLWSKKDNSVNLNTTTLDDPTI
jgi:hypothetical protein